MNTRLFYILTATITILFFTNSAMAAAESEQAKAHVEEAGGAFISALADTSIAEEKKAPLFEELIQRYTDIRWMAGFVAGRAASNAEKSEKEAFYKLYPQYLVKSYLPKFGQFQNREQIVKKVQKDTKGYLVLTTISNGSSEPIDLRYRIHFVDGKPMIFDMLAEGVSLIVTQRSEFSSYIQRKGFSAFVNKMRKYVAS